MRQAGFSLTELLISLTISGIVAGLALPAIGQQYYLNQLTQTLNEARLQFVRAQTTAMYSQQDTFIAMQSGEHWCMAVATAQCDCARTDSCAVVSEYPVLDNQRMPRVTLAESSFTPSHYATFAAGEGHANGKAGSLLFDIAGRQGRLVLSNQGRIRLCLINMTYGSFPAC